MSKLGFSVTSWSGWSDIEGMHALNASPDSNIIFNQNPDAKCVPAMLRRRLNLMGKACMTEMLKHLEDNENIPVIFCSRHGDIRRTLSILSEMAKNEPMSPIDFSLAVHNAIVGILSIHQGITANISSIATYQGSLIPTIVEAVGLLSPTTPKIMCIISDVPLPEIYRNTEDHNEFPYVACFTISQNKGVNLVLNYEKAESSVEKYSEHSQPLDFINFLASTQTEFLACHNSGRWVVSKQTAM